MITCHLKTRLLWSAGLNWVLSLILILTKSVMGLVRVTEPTREDLTFNFLYIVLDIIAFACSIGLECPILFRHFSRKWMQPWHGFMLKERCMNVITLTLITDLLYGAYNLKYKRPCAHLFLNRSPCSHIQLHGPRRG